MGGILQKEKAGKQASLSALRRWAVSFQTGQSEWSALQVPHFYLGLPFWVDVFQGGAVFLLLSNRPEGLKCLIETRQSHSTK